MSREDVDVVLAFTAAYSARDIDAAVDLCAADVNVFPDASVFPESGSLVGRDKFRSFVEETWSAWSSVVARPKEVLDIGDGRVLLRADWGGTGMASGIETYRDLSVIYTVRDGEISNAEFFFDHDKALRAVGLPQLTMSQNVEIVKRAIDAFNRGDVDAFAEFTTSDFEWFPALPGNVEGGGYEGREGIETYTGEIRDTWEELRVFGEEFRDLGDRVLVLGRAEGRGRGSGVPVATSHGFVVELRGEKICRVRTYLDHGQALRAAGEAG